MNENIKLLEKKIGISFKNRNLLKQSLTHKSFDSDQNNEKLEFLGDRVLGLIISKNLLETFPLDKEGVLDKKLASLVNRKKCLEIAEKFKLTKYVLTGNTNTKKNKIEDKIVSDACEAIIGAIFIDQGLNAAEKFILKFWQDELIINVKEQIDAKTKLQEYSLKKYKSLPKYKLLGTTGPKHKPSFKIAVRLHNSNYFNASGSSKKDAEQKAAALLLKKIGI